MIYATYADFFSEAILVKTPTFGAHAHEGYSTLSVCLSATSVLVSFHIYMTNVTGYEKTDHFDK